MFLVIGSGGGTRTPDKVVNSHPLCRLSYSGISISVRLLRGAPLSRAPLRKISDFPSQCQVVSRRRGGKPLPHGPLWGMVRGLKRRQSSHLSPVGRQPGAEIIEQPFFPGSGLPTHCVDCRSIRGSPVSLRRMLRPGGHPLLRHHIRPGPHHRAVLFPVRLLRRSEGPRRHRPEVYLR